MSLFIGKRLSPGIATGLAWVIASPELHKLVYATASAAEEKNKFLHAIESVDQDLSEIEKNAETKELAEIIGAHRMLLQDPEWQEQITAQIAAHTSAPDAVKTVTKEFSAMMAALEDPYLRERARDIEDVGSRVEYNLRGINTTVLLPPTGSYILVAEDLTPSQFASLDKKRVLGLVTEKGGVTSHTAIMARLYEIPAISGIENATKRLQANDWLCVHADKSQLHVNSDEKTKLQKLETDYKALKEELYTLKDKPSTTIDGVKVHLEANIGKESDLELVHKYGAEGVGLFRTEFLFFDRSEAPSEEEQYKSYLQVGTSLQPYPVVVRSFDIGADKQVPYLAWPKEENPFLGLRALRYSLQNKALFHEQLRAFLRASHVTPLSLMFPMVSCLEELQAAKKELKICEDAVRAQGLKPQYKMGIMIEVPAAALIADSLAKEVDFFSIGTNDLIQYVCAVDRMNESVAHLYQSFHPGVLNLIAQVIAAGKRHDTEVAMCGEMAADLDLIPVLFGMGLRIFSQSPATVLRSKHLIRKLQSQDCEALWQKVREQGSAAAIQKLCEEFRQSIK